MNNLIKSSGISLEDAMIFMADDNTNIQLVPREVCLGASISIYDGVAISSYYQFEAYGSASVIEAEMSRDNEEMITSELNMDTVHHSGIVEGSRLWVCK